MIVLNFEEDIILEDERVLLRPLQVSDVSELKDFATLEPALWKFSMQPVSSEKDLEHYIQQAIKERSAGKAYPFIVFDKEKKRFAGSTRFYDFLSAYGNVSIGYSWIGKEFQKSGLNTHMKFVMLQYAFEKMNADRVEFRADARNLNSIRAMKRIGCTQEGILRSNGIAADCVRRDSVVLSILKEEWETKVKEHFQNHLL